MARRIEVEIVGDSRKLEQAFARSERSARKFDQQMGRSSRSASASLGSVAVGWQTAVAGGAFLLGRQFVKASRDAEVILGQTRVALSDAGLSWERYGKTIEDASGRISRSSAFDDEAVLQSFQTFVRGQKDVARSIELTELAADVARGRYIDLEQATQLVNKAAMGQTGALRRAGIQIDKNATSAEALDALLKAYSGSAATYADSATGSSEKLAVAWENLSEVAGGPLSNSLANVADQLTLIVSLMERAGSIKLPTGAGTLGDLVGKLASTPPFIGPLLNAIDAFGGGRPAGAAGPATPATMPTPPTSSFFFGGQPKDMSAGSFFDALDNITAFTTKWVGVGARYAAAQKRFLATQKQLAAERERMQLKQRRVLAGRENQLGWLDFGLEKAQSTKSNADNLRVLRKREELLKSWIAKEGRTLNLVRELWRTRDQIRDLNKSKADKDPLAGLMQVSSKRLAQTLAVGTGLGAGGMGRLQANIAGAEIQPTHVHLHVDGREIASVVTTHQTRGGARTARQTSGFRG